MIINTGKKWIYFEKNIKTVKKIKKINNPFCTLISWYEDTRNPTWETTCITKQKNQFTWNPYLNKFTWKKQRSNVLISIIKINSSSKNVFFLL